LARKKREPAVKTPKQETLSLFQANDSVEKPKRVTRRKKTSAEVVSEIQAPLLPHPMAGKAREIASKLSVIFDRARSMVDPPDEEPTKRVKKPSEEDKPARMAELQSDLGECERCELCLTRKNIVFGSGSLDAKLMIVGEAPGAREDLTGEPFVGEAGDMLDLMLKHVLQIERKDVYIANAVKCRPPENRDPLSDEISACTRFLKRQIEIIAPKVILVFGSIACHSLLESKVGVTRCRGRWLAYGEIPAMATFHPAYLLRQPGEKPKTNGDLLEVKKRLATEIAEAALGKDGPVTSSKPVR
jgi:uracil-DNA glycosylase family 4